MLASRGGRATTMDTAFDQYLHALRQDRDEKTELSDRGALEILLNASAHGADSNIRIVHEAKKVRGKGGPDFKVMRSGMILGYVEDKAIGVNLDEVLKSDQITRYKQLSGNILLTDYLQFIWLKDGKVNGRELIAFPHDLEGKVKKPREDRVMAVSTLLRGFFSTAPEGIGRSEQLALALATRSHFLRDFLDKELQRQAKEHREGRLYGLFQIFRDQVFHELTVVEFADAFAQMLAYGLFLARLNSGSREVTLANARELVPGSFRLIRELVQFLDDLHAPEYVEIRWVVEEILSIVNGLDLAAIQGDLSFKHRKAISRKVRAKDAEEHRLFERDPFIYFYEDFLGKYDAKMKKSRGVYYTPPPIVNFIVRAIDDILKDTFAIKDGLADHNRVTVLDFACGTGTFLLEVFERIFENIGGSDSAKANLIVREHMLKNVFGFEYLIAPYTIAHLKLSQYLGDRGHALQNSERLQVFLTNTLEPVEPQKNFLLPGITAEVEAAQKVKDREILVITGNPPYAGHSKNNGDWIKAQIDAYKLVDGKPLGEKNPKWLQDDYVKFIRFAQLKMDAVDEGVVAIITNHSYIDNPTFRGMRRSLMSTFNQIYILDLHGSSKPKELSPPDIENENVFDIQKGVAVALFVKSPRASSGIHYGEFWGTRLEKYKRAASSRPSDIEWRPVNCAAPYWMLRPLDWTGWEQYQNGWAIADSLNPSGEKAQIFGLNVLGFQSHRDDFAIAFSRAEIEARVADFRSTTLLDRELAEKYALKNNRDWNIPDARVALRLNDKCDKNIIRCAYRPFDNPFSFFGYEVMDYPRRELLVNVANRDNLSLVVSRQIGTANWRHVFVADAPANDCLVSDQSSEASQIFPLWRFDEQNKRAESFAVAFRHFLDSRYDRHYTPEEIFGYIYAVLNAPAFRNRYVEFLRIDFPRVPFPEATADFEQLSLLGWALVQAHLLREVPRRGLAAYRGKGDHAVDAPRYSPEDQSVALNNSQSFAPVPQAVWDFHIGGYQVLEKYLKSRRRRKLSLDEINHFATVADSLAFTIDQMALIDMAYLEAFPDGG